MGLFDWKPDDSWGEAAPEPDPFWGWATPPPTDEQLQDPVYGGPGDDEE